mgnify:CR=1 FL=1
MIKTNVNKGRTDIRENFGIKAGAALPASLLHPLNDSKLSAGELAEAVRAERKAQPAAQRSNLPITKETLNTLQGMIRREQGLSFNIEMNISTDGRSELSIIEIFQRLVGMIGTYKRRSDYVKALFTGFIELIEADENNLDEWRQNNIARSASETSIQSLMEMAAMQSAYERNVIANKELTERVQTDVTQQDQSVIIQELQAQVAKLSKGAK